MFNVNSIMVCVFLSQLATIELQEEVEWVKFNVDMDGYYVVHYAEGDWQILIDLLKREPTALSANDRAHLINNIFSLVG